MDRPPESSKESPERTYSNPPVVEAFCEVYFTAVEWDTLSHQLFHKEVKERFPKMEKRMAAPTGTLKSQERTDVKTERFLCFSKEGNQLIQVSSEFLVFNQLVPFLPFHEWGEGFLCAVSKYIGLFSPEEVDRIGVKYINRIEIPQRRVTMNDYFTIYPSLPLGSGNVHGPFLIDCVIPQGTANHILTINFSSMEREEPGEDSQAFRLEFYEQALIEKFLTEDELREQVGIAHSNVVHAFEGSITDNLRSLFDREGQHE